MKHARLPPSAADRWFACPGSIAAEDPFPNTTSVYAEEGIRAHELLEMALRLGSDPMTLVDPEDEAAKLMAEAVGHAADYVTAWCELHPGSDYHVEQELKWGEMWGRSDLYGTSDVVLTSPEKHAIVDLKYGQGVVVEVEDNKQLGLYLLGVRTRYGQRQSYEKVIIQPRAYSRSGPVRIECITDKELLAFADAAQRAVHLAESAKASRHAGEHCRWCRAAGVCTTLADYSLRMAAAQFSCAAALSGEDFVATVPGNLDNAGLGRLLRYLPLVEVWARAVASEALNRALNGQKIPGYKLVLGKPPNRSWLDEVEAIKVLQGLKLKLDEIAPRELVSPAGAERVMLTHKLSKEVRTKTIAPLVTRKAGNPTLTEASDPREEYTPFQEFKE